jgi:hypothetical protein
MLAFRIGKKLAPIKDTNIDEVSAYRPPEICSGSMLEILQHHILCRTSYTRALIPALNRLEMEPVGAFRLDIGPETPTYYVLVRATSAEALVALDTRLGKDTEYVKAASGFRDAPASAPAFVRAERSLLSAFAGWPKLVTPKKEKRIFQLRPTRVRARSRTRARSRCLTSRRLKFLRGRD